MAGIGKINDLKQWITLASKHHFEAIDTDGVA